MSFWYLISGGSGLGKGRFREVNFCNSGLILALYSELIVGEKYGQLDYRLGDVQFCFIIQLHAVKIYHSGVLGIQLERIKSYYQCDDQIKAVGSKNFAKNFLKTGGSKKFGQFGTSNEDIRLLYRWVSNYVYYLKSTISRSSGSCYTSFRNQVPQRMPGGYIPGLPSIYPMTLGVSPNMSCLEPADSNCTYGIHWIWVSMGLCVMDAKGGIALFCGILCLFIWIAVGIPQIIENFRTGIADKALSLGFLFFWTFGDILNLIGCFLTHQLIMQIVVTGYCVISDFVLVFQFIYYKIRHNAVLRQMATILKDGEISPSPSAPSPTLFEDSANYNSHQEYRRLPICFVGAASFTLAVISLTSVENPFNTYFTYQQIPSSFRYQSRRLLEWGPYESTDYPSIDSDPLDGTVIKVGYILGWISTCMYLFSRLPQLFRNWKRRSTEGLSMFMFSMTVTGNISYGVQILLTSTEKNFLIRATPWIVGSLGVVLLDTLMLCQFCLYQSQQHKNNNDNNSQEQNNLLGMNSDQTEIV
ncbi:hypothetical protein MN116_003208 [Schistosoma mekongi]|uniref:PQ-loop repeat-containing protein 2 n=1 Tax=Schistosoma mekongi TaxID=38744 RepID=A0AAE1ZI78_SCHME|nr:hypothetical protein MN116_003208 [Schistosoma mekongi]